MNIAKKILCFAVIIFLFIGCGERTTESGSRKHLPRDKQVPVLNDVRAYISKPTGVKNSGLIVFKQDPTNPLKLEIVAEITQVFDSTGGRLANSQFGLYSPGIKHKFVSTCQFPVSPTAIIDGKLQFMISNKGGNNFIQVMTKEGWVAKNGTVVVKGPGFIIRTQDSPSICIESSEEFPLVFELTPDGYRYIEGNGRVVTLEGKTISFSR
jgi:hypothetical protein